MDTGASGYPSPVEEKFKCAKVRFQMALNESRDLAVSGNACPLTARCKRENQSYQLRKESRP